MALEHSRNGNIKLVKNQNTLKMSSDPDLPASGLIPMAWLSLSLENCSVVLRALDQWVEG